MHLKISINRPPNATLNIIETYGRPLLRLIAIFIYPKARESNAVFLGGQG